MALSWGMIMSRGFPLAVAVLIGVSSISQIAKASTFDAIITGVFDLGAFDATGVFGKANTSLAGKSFSAVVTVDTSKGAFLTLPGTELLRGGTVDGNSSPVSATFTANGHTIDFSGAQLGTFSVDRSALPPPSQEIVVSDISNVDSDLTLGLQFSLDPRPGLGDLISVLSGITTFNPDQFNFSVGGQHAFGPLIVQTYEIDGATPLPAALPLFTTGLGAMGFLGWRRKRKNAAALAAA